MKRRLPDRKHAIVGGGCVAVRLASRIFGPMQRRQPDQRTDLARSCGASPIFPQRHGQARSQRAAQALRVTGCPCQFLASCNASDDASTIPTGT
jgi:hypothetical protein